ncbi:16S rRNA (cytidine(1402)-2'-O)-methyltransferase [Thiohalobacter sp.]|uniref:16S rRNA (cytidine(1402)-2'-O)-methyltransferase n=1 Tax=Thiohalobacter sp. TaxID=2025948 RepID=UPI00260CD216|nr:16S rRNA (cytidine(1402)-2'-O)-methyltransferase [Thiohalobacter sp.]
MSGQLFVVATPIGNLGDLSPRARETLAAVDLIAAEDTRHSRHLLAHFGIRRPLVALHEHNERERSGQLIERLRAGESVALISDAGTPLISDPGYRLVRAAREAGVPVVPIPGPSALIAALSVAGLPTDRFVFEGFLPAKAQARRSRLQVLAGEPRTLVFYESSHRIQAMLGDLAATFGAAREAVLARELTKQFEQIEGGRLDQLCAWLDADEHHRRGEFVVLVAGAPPEEAEAGDARRMLEILLRELPVKRAAAVAAELTGRRRNELYRLALALSGQNY